jgi:regulator of telomere elongation helicase 1
MKLYKKDAGTNRGALLMAVCRGKVAEGMDLIDEMARCVFMVGIPYPSFVDQRFLLYSILII